MYFVTDFLFMFFTFRTKFMPFLPQKALSLSYLLHTHTSKMELLYKVILTVCRMQRVKQGKKDSKQNMYNNIFVKLLYVSPRTTLVSTMQNNLLPKISKSNHKCMQLG